MIRKSFFRICFALFLAPLALNATGKNTLHQTLEEGSVYVNQPQAIPVHVANSTFYIPLAESSSLALARQIAGDAGEIAVDQLDGVSEEEKHASELDEGVLQFIRPLPPLEKVMLAFNQQGSLQCCKLDQHEEGVVSFIPWHVAESFAPPAMSEALVKMYTTDGSESGFDALLQGCLACYEELLNS